MTEDDLSAMKDNIHILGNAVQMSYKKVAGLAENEKYDSRRAVSGVQPSITGR